ncbi:MAG: adenosine-specific kinase [Planctomycetes bacterium]|nr:adenosine-specific kinase [Planctomycetota bacterium]MBI3845649.1 adenosine-specific kinase [Planctomycetota bacterium]
MSDRTTIEAVRLEIPNGANVVLGHAHFIKTVEDLYEIVAGSVPQAKFGVAFSEASGPCLVRLEGNDRELVEVARKNIEAVAAGHTFCIVVRDAYPINFLNAIKSSCAEVCTVHCATANPVQVIVARTDQGGGVIGVVDGSSPKGAETETHRVERKALLRKFGYKL